MINFIKKNKLYFERRTIHSTGNSKSCKKQKCSEFPNNLKKFYTEVNYKLYFIFFFDVFFWNSVYNKHFLYI